MNSLSIITPVYNNRSYIEKCILNVISQDCTEAEHLIIDGGSTDGTVEIIVEYAEKYPHIHWLSEKDDGQSDAMNKGIKLAKGKYISFLNVDDYYDEGVLNRIQSIIRQVEAPKFLVGDCRIWDQNNELLYINRPRKLKTWHILSGYYFPVNPSAYFYQKEIHEVVGDYNVDNHYNMDIEFLIEASLVTDLKYYPEIWGNFRLLPDTKTVSDQQNGILEQRKEELFQTYLEKSGPKIRRKVEYVKSIEKWKRKFVRLKKKIIRPFDVVYWKIKKTIAGNPE